MKIGIPLATKPMMTMVTISGGVSASGRRSLFTAALPNTRSTKGSPTPMGKKDQVISVEPTIQIDTGAPRQTTRTMVRPRKIDRKVNLD